MRWIRKNKMDAAVFVLVAAALAVFAAFLVQGMGSYAEAVIGEAGNLGTAGTGHPHNLSSSSTGVRAVSEQKICIFCHTPHRALTDDGLTNASLLNAPLWNHELTVASYTVMATNATPFYNAPFSNTMAVLSTVPNYVDGASRLCLSCHDGTVAIGAVYTRYPYASSPKTANDIAMDTSSSCIDASGYMASSGCSAFIGQNLTTKHVVSIPMNDALIAAALANCTSGPPNASIKLQYPWDSSTPEVLLRPVGSYNKFGGNPGITKSGGAGGGDYRYKDGYNYGVQCSTCHDPHYWVNTSDANVAGYKMIVAGFNVLCAACHILC